MLNRLFTIPFASHLRTTQVTSPFGLPSPTRPVLSWTPCYFWLSLLLAGASLLPSASLGSYLTSLYLSWPASIHSDHPHWQRGRRVDSPGEGLGRDKLRGINTFSYEAEVVPDIMAPTARSTSGIQHVSPLQHPWSHFCLRGGSSVAILCCHYETSSQQHVLFDDLC